jgi:diguanylate cyclase (GGDEF)-like protein
MVVGVEATMKAVLTTPVAIAAVCAIGWLDLSTGTRASMSLFYVTVVGWVAWRAGYGAAFLTGALAAAWWLAADLAQSTHNSAGTSVWNAATRLAIFVSIGLFVRRLHDTQRNLEDANARLSERLDAESRFARTDLLTGLRNRTGFLETLRREVARSQRAATPFGVLYLDLDNFKRVNDMHGHDVGDRVLRSVAATIREAVRITDVPARLGGDEFAIFCWNIGADALEELAARLVTRIALVGDDYPETGLGASVGVAWFGEPPPSEDDVLKHADAAMYAAKKSGKGRFRVIRGEALSSDGPGAHLRAV